MAGCTVVSKILWQPGKLLPLLGYCFYFRCLTYMDICIRPSLEFRRIMLCHSGFTSFITDSEIRLRVYVSILVLARWNLCASTERQQQQLSHCHGASVLSVKVFLMPF